MNETNDITEALINEIKQLTSDYKRVKDECNRILESLSRLQLANPPGMLSADDVQALSSQVDVSSMSNNLPF